MRLNAEPASVVQTEPLPRRFIRNKSAFRQLREIHRRQTPEITSTLPENDEPDDEEKDVAVSPAEPPIGANTMALSAAVRSIINLRATRRTLHGLSTINALELAPSIGRRFHLCIRPWSHRCSLSNRETPSTRSAPNHSDARSRMQINFPRCAMNRDA